MNRKKKILHKITMWCPPLFQSIYLFLLFKKDNFYLSVWFVHLYKYYTCKFYLNMFYIWNCGEGNIAEAYGAIFHFKCLPNRAGLWPWYYKVGNFSFCVSIYLIDNGHFIFYLIIYCCDFIYARWKIFEELKLKFN